MARHEQMDVAHMHPSLNYPMEFQGNADDFFGVYALQNDFVCPDVKMKGLKPPKERVCRFCKRKWPEVTFRKDAHLFPEFLGNRYLIYDSECDTCNQKFGSYEDHLAKYLGVARTILSVKGKEKVPKVKSPGEEIVFESNVNEEGLHVVKVTRAEVESQVIQMDRKTLMQTIEFTKHPYVPLKVYKAFLKMALGSLSEADIPNYGRAFESMISDQHDKALLGWAGICRWTLPYTYCHTRPVGMLYRKRDPQRQIYTHIFVLSTLNFIYEFPIPFGMADEHLPTQVAIPIVPPIFGGEYPFPVDTIRYSSMNLQMAGIVRNEKEVISFPLPKEVFQDREVKDPDTGEVHFEPFDPKDIIGIELIRVTPQSPGLGPSLITTTG